MKTIKSQSVNVKRFRKMVMGVDVRVPVQGNKSARFINFDNAASTPALKPVYEKLKDYLKWYSGVHRGTGYKSILSSQLFDECHEDIARFVKADPERDAVIIVKNTTEAINKLSYRLNLSPTDMVVSTMMEHHSNDLPWRRAGRVDYAGLDSEGRLDLKDVSRKLRFWYPRVRLLTVCGASNVTGHINDIGRLAALAHEYGARFMLDAAQYAPHLALDMKPHGHPEHIDYLAFSGHKIYAPFGAGVLIGPQDTFLKGAPEYVGGGTVALVGKSQVKWGGVPDRDEAGSPNLLGALALTETLKILDSIGMENITAYEEQLTEFALRLLKEVPGLTIYGSLPRVGVVSFSMRDVNHSLLGAILVYEGGIGVRTGCFCAQPYVRHLLGQEEPVNLDEYARLPVWQMPGLVRISLGAYNTFAEIEKLVELLHRIAAHKKEYQREYVLDLDRTGYMPRSGSIPFPINPGTGNKCPIPAGQDCRRWPAVLQT